MPASFDPDSLRASLQPLVKRQPLSTEAQAYQHFYSLDIPGAESWLGRFDTAGFELVAQVWLPSAPVATLVLLH